MIGDVLLIRRVFARFWGRIGGLLPIIGGVLLIRRVLAGFWGGIGGLLAMIGGAGWGIPVLHVSADELGMPGLITRILQWAHQQLAA